MASYSAVDAMWERGSQSSSAKKTSTSSNNNGRTSGGFSGGGSGGITGGARGGLGASTGNGSTGILGDILTAEGTALAGLTGNLGQTSIGNGSYGGTNNGITIGGTMGSSETAMKYNREMMELANKAAAEEAQKNRDWQKMMSDTAFQRAVEDMKKAGINPILAAGAQAPMGSGSAASTHMAAGMPEQYNYGRNEGSQWGVNSSYSYNNFAEAIEKVMRGLGDVIERMGEGSGKRKVENAAEGAAQAAADITKITAKTIWQAMTKSLYKGR